MTEDDIDLTTEEIRMWRKVYAYMIIPSFFYFLFAPSYGMWNRFPLLLSVGGYTYFTLLLILDLTQPRPSKKE